MKVVVDFDRCKSNANCVYAAPDIFRLEEDGSLIILNEEPPEADREAVEDAVRTCPVSAISIV